MDHPPIVGTDANDSTVYPVDFEMAHRQGIPHRSVHIEVRWNDRWLVWRRLDGRWEIPGGHVDWLVRENVPESYDNAALRESCEELSLDANWSLSKEEACRRIQNFLRPMGQILNRNTVDTNYEHVGLFELCWQPEWGDPCEFALGPEVHSKPRWMTLAEIFQLAEENPAQTNSALRLMLSRNGQLVRRQSETPEFEQ
jgi:8-oxo-dGTP pyrophosphatase MutT (NUDIX family)